MAEDPRDTQSPEREPAPASPLLRLYPALASRDFRVLWLGMLPSTLAWQMSVVTTGYAALTLSGVATAIGLVTVSTGLPLFVLAPLGGVIADRLPRRSVLLTTQTGLGLGAAALAALALTGLLQVWHLVALGLVQGCAFAFNMPARQAYMAELVGPRMLRNAVALNNAGMNFCRIGGPALAGVLLGIPAIGVGGVFTLMTGFYTVVIVSLLQIHPRKPSEGDGKPAQGAGGWAQLLEGFRYIRSSPALKALLGLAFLTSLIGMPYQLLMPLFSEHIFQVGGAGLGLMMGAVGVGSLLGSLAVAALSETPRPAVLQLGLGVGFGLALLGFALTPAFALAVVVLLVVGFLSASYIAFNNTLVMSNTEPHLYGRVMSLYLLTFAVMPLGALPLSWLADQIGGRAAVGGAGLVVAAAVAGVALLYPAYRSIR